MANRRRQPATVSKNFPMANIGQKNNQSSQMQQQQQEKPPITQDKKISISDAIGLITIRLSRLESKISNTPQTSIDSNTNESETMQYVNKDTIIDIVKRLESLEKTYNDNLKAYEDETKVIMNDIDTTNSNVSTIDEKINQLYLNIEELKSFYTVKSNSQEREEMNENDNLKNNENESVDIMKYIEITNSNVTTIDDKLDKLYLIVDEFKSFYSVKNNSQESEMDETIISSQDNPMQDEEEGDEENNIDEVSLVVDDVEQSE